MSLAIELFGLARMLASHPDGKPSQASLRRCISTAYYAVFNLLLDDAMAVAAPAEPSGLRGAVRRAFTHADMIAACRSVRKDQPLRFMPTPVSADIIAVARAFEDLQDARLLADYDVERTTDLGAAEEALLAAETAFVAWAAVRASPDAQVFLLAMLLGKRLARA